MPEAEAERRSKSVDAVIRNFIVIGEVARNVSEGIAARHPSNPWWLIGNMPSFAVHDYWKVYGQTSPLRSRLSVFVSFILHLLFQNSYQHNILSFWKIGLRRSS
jgi:hypothetical protein